MMTTLEKVALERHTMAKAVREKYQDRLDKCTTIAERNRVIAERDRQLSDLHKQEKLDKGLSGLSKNSTEGLTDDDADDFQKLVAAHKKANPHLTDGQATTAVIRTREGSAAYLADRDKRMRRSLAVQHGQY
jgi:hypothetical protein